MRNLRRLRAFVRDLLDELPMVWSLARTNDCERNGGHQWEEDKSLYVSVNGCRTWTCSRCECSQIIRTTTTGSAYPVHLMTGGSPR